MLELVFGRPTLALGSALVHLTKQHNDSSCLKHHAAKNGTILATVGRIYGPVNWVCITIESMEKYHLPL